MGHRARPPCGRSRQPGSRLAGGALRCSARPPRASRCRVRGVRREDHLVSRAKLDVVPGGVEHDPAAHAIAGPAPGSERESESSARQLSCARLRPPRCVSAICGAPCGAEGATKGIMIATSAYGPDSYKFAGGKPLNLIDGSGLLGALSAAIRNPGALSSMSRQRKTQCVNWTLPSPAVGGLSIGWRVCPSGRLRRVPWKFARHGDPSGHIVLMDLGGAADAGIG